MSAHVTKSATAVARPSKLVRQPVGKAAYPEWNTTGGITHYSEFSGCGGTSDGASMVPGVVTVAAANHDEDAIASHELNFPHAEHFREDITKLPMEDMPWCHLATFSPACPAWTTANGVKRDFDKVNAEQPSLFDMPEDPKKAARSAEYKRSRLLMMEVPRYLRGQAERGRPVPIGWVENVIQCRKWAEWDNWIDEIRKLGYHIKLIAFNSMHARPVKCARAPQSRDRLYVAFWHASLGRTPDWDKWLRPQAWCGKCGQVVDAVQVFKDPTNDMGRYGSQYIYQCPAKNCRREVSPQVQPALDVIDTSIPGIRIGDRTDLGMDSLAVATLTRIATGVRKYWLPLLTPVGGTWRADGVNGAQPLDRPFPTQTTRETDGVAVPPLMVPVEGRPGKFASPAHQPLRTQTTRAETGVAMPFIAPLRGGGDLGRARAITDPLTTVCASGNHHGLAIPPANDLGALAEWADSLLVPYYGASDSAQPATRDRYAIANGTPNHLADQALAAVLGRVEAFAGRVGKKADPARGGAGYDPVAEAEHALAADDLIRLLADVRFRMLEPHEIGAAMAFRPDYLLSATSKRDRVRLFGNAVTPPVAEIITSALVECLTGEQLPRELAYAS